MEKSQEEQAKEERRAEEKALIQIPSYHEVFGGGGTSSSHPYNPPPPSFSEAFSFIKSSEFYTLPPPQEQAPRNVPEPQVSASAMPPSSSSFSSAASSSYSAVSSSSQNRNSILVSHRQKGNPLLKHIRNVRWAFADIVCDFFLGQSSCALYISLRYHLLHPDYLYYRIRELQKMFKLRLVLCHIDVEDVVKPLSEVIKTATFHDCTLLCAWSLEECGRYLETIKVYENKPADTIREQTNTDYLSRLTHALTTIRSVNKTDVLTLGSNFGQKEMKRIKGEIEERRRELMTPRSTESSTTSSTSEEEQVNLCLVAKSLSRIMDASMEDLACCPGIGERKVKRLYDTFHEPFQRFSRRSAVTIPEAFSRNKRAEESTKDEGEKSAIDVCSFDASEDEKRASIDVRSALDAAFAKYAEKVCTPAEQEMGRDVSSSKPQKDAPA